MTASPVVVILAVGCLVATSCALVGTFLVLRRMALLGDAISHSVLPGIVLAFLVTGSRAALPMVLGAGALGVLTVFLVERLNRTRRLYEDASIGVVFPALFAVGVILVSRYTAAVDLDLDCVLYGEIAYTPWDAWVVGETNLGPRALWINGAVLLVDLALVGLLYKELQLSSFDPALAAALGFSPVLMHYVLMGAVSVTVVGAFESVGAILVVALLVVPPATAFLLTRRLVTMLVVAVALGIASVGLGYAFARRFDFSIAGGIATCSGVLFLVALVLSPSQGFAAGIVRRRKMAVRLAARLLLLHLDRDGTAQREEAVRSRLGWGRRRMTRVTRELATDGFVERDAGGLRLTPSGARMVDGPLGDLAGHRG